MKETPFPDEAQRPKSGNPAQGMMSSNTLYNNTGELSTNNSKRLNLFADGGILSGIDAHMNIDVKETADGQYFYSFAIKKGTAPQAVLAEVTENNSATVPSNDSLAQDGKTVNTHSVVQVFERIIDVGVS